MDIASLGIEVRTDGVNRATQDLNRLSQACDEVDSAAEGVGQSFRQTSQGLGSANAQTRQAAINLRDVGVSARQTQAALRQLPAQFSDIVISLQGGQNPLSVFLQQGSQIKDSFGGVGPALRETARYAAGLINPFTAGAAAVGLLGVAYYQGSKESSAFNKAIISSGNFAGVSAGQLQEMAASIRGVDVTQRQAAAGLAEFTSAGVFTAEQLQSMTAAAIRWEDATGKAVSDTVTEFKKLAADPVKASEDLNRQYNYLTASVYEQISALQAQGKESEAAQVAEKAYADALSERSTNVKESLGTIETAWNDVAKAAKGAWDAALDIGREKTIDEKIAELKQRIKEVAEVGTSGPSGRARYQLGLGPGGEGDLPKQLSLAEIEKEQQDGIARWKAESAKVNQEGIAATREVFALRESLLSKQEKKEKEIAKYWENANKVRAANPFTQLFSEEQIKKDLAGIEAKYADKTRTPRQKAYQDDAATKMLMSLREEQSALEAQLSTNEKLTSEQKKRAEFEALIAQIKSKDVLTAEQKSLLASQDAIKAQLDQNVALSEEVKLRQESIKFLERAAQIEENIKNANENRQQQYERMLAGAGMGSRERQRINEQNDIAREFNRYREQLTRRASEGVINGDEYASALAKIDKGYKDALASSDAFYREDDKNRGNWVNGANDAFADYIDSAKNVSGQTYDLFNKAFTGLEDSIVEFAMTGKLSFKELANSIIEDLIRIQTRKALAFAIGGDSGGGSGAFGSLLSMGANAAMSYFGGGVSASAAGSLAAGASQSGYAMDLSNFVAGARAGGGPVSAGSMYQVGENNRPELLTQGGRSYLIPGDGGNVTPIKGGGTNISAQMIFALPNVTNAREAREASGVIARNVARSISGAGRYS